MNQCKTTHDITAAERRRRRYAALSGGVMAMMLVGAAAAIGTVVILGTTDLVESGLTQTSLQIGTATMHKIADDNIVMTLNVKNIGSTLLVFGTDTPVITIQGSDSGASWTATYAYERAVGTDDICSFNSGGTMETHNASKTYCEAMNTPAKAELGPGESMSFTGRISHDPDTPAWANAAKGSEAVMTISFNEVSQSVGVRVR